MSPFSPAALFTSLTLNSLLTIWCSGQTALFLSFLAKAALAYWPTAFSVVLRPLFSFQQAQHAQVFPLKPAPFRKLFAGLGSTNKSATALLFSYLIFALSSLSSFLLPQSLWQELSSLSSFTLKLQWVHRHSFLLRNHSANKLARWGTLLVPFVIPCSLFSLISRIYSSLFSDWRRAVSSKFFDTQVSSILTEELVFPRHAPCVPSRLRCNGLSLLLSSYLSRIGRIENPSCSACEHPSLGTSHLIVHCPATDSARLALLQFSVSLRPLVQARGSCSVSGAPRSSAMPPSLGRGRVTTTTAKLKLQTYYYVTKGVGKFRRS